MANWREFEASAPDLAQAGRWLFGQNGGVAFIATVRRDGSPQLHPVMPHVVEGALYVFIVSMSSKYRDLLRDGRYALHAIPAGEANQEFLISGRATRLEAPGTRGTVEAATGGPRHEWEVLFALDIEKALGTRWDQWGTPQAWPAFTRWKAASKP